MLTDLFSIQGKRIVVTGAGKGIGKCICEDFAELGASVACLARTEEDLRATADLIKDRGGVALPVTCDVTDENSIAEAVAKVRDEFGGVDGLINNAGGPGVGWGPIEDVDMQRFESTVRLNLSSVYAVSRACIADLKQSRGTIVNISSAMSWIAENNLAAYGAAKAGVIQMTRLQAYEFAPDVRVNAINPGAIETPGIAAMVRTDEDRKKFSRWIQMQRIGRPRDIAAAALYLLSDASSFVTGKILDVDGGLMAMPGSAIESRIAEAGYQLG